MHAALDASTICLKTDWRPVALRRRSDDSTERVLDVLIESARSLSRSRNRIILDMQAAQRAVDHCSLGNDRAYRLLWNLFDFPSAPSLQPTQPPQSYPLLDALDATEVAFRAKPFAVLPQASSGFGVLNHSRRAAEQHATTMEVVGARFVETHLLHPFGVAELGDVQHLVFEHLSDGLVSKVKGQVGSLFLGEDDTEKSSFEDKLAQLEKALADARASRKNAKFSIAFFGMVKAGKSLFLNALIGRSILPSDGMTFTPSCARFD